MALGILDRLLVADTDLDEAYEQEMPCEIGTLPESGKAPWCVDTGEWLMRVTCRKCGNGKRFIACEACRVMIQKVFRLAQVVTIFSSTPSCPHRLISYRLTFVKL